MWLKIVIVFLFLAVLASLSSALFFLLRDMGAPESKRTLYALGIRITLAALLLLAIWYGFDSGLLSNTAPWADKY
ncbi:DUF2909 domain-containing protein [Microbulbifer thermotolerans]|uniref:DUF2909 domain-containing protein n=1 Tax=Microbulbifer thermotolerans TaxID=252514 RepID=A0A143HI84_MICTH|nr:DUF2909 domain-containing protein [Microbulbifer thermotolerans]AMX01216.1 hypothetical protein A3224_00230 [Microbulbifer thermotolerans]MCX2778467.1 DUF2909 domain-containing protein [Microbulbifer thermotolerans]MCX2793951.1 DUF2909 domain-containing protein [Microbulbifer thermotolerans]MCX2801655.1 DUF2909 domain-containing protein [Microbulbifer thermotolerans]MCX2804024.1 DUF2909 domain-containing protein [Microbulbifer thermotolerans]